MSDHTRARRPWPRVWATVAGLLTASVLGALAQPPVEEEDPKGGLKKRVVVDDPVIVKPKGPDAGTNTPPDLRLDELARGIDDVTHAAFKELYRKHVVPFDRLTTKAGAVRIKPIPVATRAELPPQFGVQELDREGRLTEPQAVNKGEVQKLESFEQVVLAEANLVLAARPFGTANGPQGWTALDQLGAAERLLFAALRFHDYARERNIRKGKGWDDIRKPLADRLREVRLFQLDNAVAVGDWPRVRETGSSLMQAYQKDSTVTVKVAAARVQEAKRLLASENHSQHKEAKALLDEFERNYPGGGGDAVRAIRGELTRLAQAAFNRAKEKKGIDDGAARSALTQAVELDPIIPGVREMQRELKTTGYQTLYVGVRQYPELLSPMLAKLDSEKQVVELLFEGLIAEVPDDGRGARYRAAGAVVMPAVSPGAREFTLRTFALDASGRYGFESHDVVSTLKFLATRPGTWAAYALPWIDEQPATKDNTTVRIAFRQGHPDPRALLTFKLLPARYMESRNVRVDDRVFAEAPLGTGPYLLQSNPKAERDVPREMVFVDNPRYSRWLDRVNQPYIKEVRLLEVAKVHNVLESFEQGSLHILPDVPTAELDTYRTRLAGKVEDHTASNNRRVHILALNHRRPAFQSKVLRQGLSLAINREAILNDAYRAGKPEYHKVMTGPFPPQSWATAKGKDGQTVPLVNRDLALTRFRTYLIGLSAQTEFELLYPDDEPTASKPTPAKVACEKIKSQIEGLFKDAPGRKITIRLAPLSTRDLLKRVHDEHGYDIAYVPFDYPDDWYPFALGAMLDPAAAERGGCNFTEYLTKDTGADGDDARLGQLLNELRAYREYGALATKTAEVQKLFNECVPFVPLWQLDRHTLYSKSVKVYTDYSDATVSPKVLDPTTLFQGIARWRLE